MSKLYELIEKWIDIKGYEGLYQVSNIGRIKSLKFNKEKILNLLPHNGGYVQIYLCKNGKSCRTFVHRLVAEHFIKNNDNKPIVNHIDGNKLNNCFKNLEWSTYSENNHHAFDMGLKNCYKKRKLTKDEVVFIRKNYRRKDKEFSSIALGLKFNVTHKTILNVINFKNYKEVI